MARVTEESPALACYFAEIRRIPVLTAEQEVALAKQMREARTALRDELGRIPRCVARLVDAWRERRDAGRVAATLCEHPEPEPGFERRLEEMLGGARATLLRRGEASPAERRRLDERLAAAFAQIDPRTDLLLLWLGRLRERAAGPAAGLARETGLAPAPLHAGLARARRQRRRYLAAKNPLVEHNLRLVVHLAKNFRHLELPFSELIQEGNLGLIRAVEKFDERRGVRLTTYAAWWISQGFVRAHQKQGRTVRVPAHVHQRLLELRRFESEFEQRHRRSPTADEVGDGLALGQEEVKLLLRARARIASLDARADEDGPVPAGLVLRDPGVRDPIADLDAERLGESVERLLGVLSERERRIVSARFGLSGEDERTLQELGDELGLSRERIRQIEKIALGKLAEAAGPLRLEELLD